MRFNITVPFVLATVLAVPSIAAPIAPYSHLFPQWRVARAAAEGSEALNVGKLVSGGLKLVGSLLRREDDDLLARSVNWNTVETAAPILAERDFDELLARADGSEAINWGTVGKTALSVAGALLRRDMDDELLARGVNWNTVENDAKKTVETVAPIVSTVVSSLAEREFGHELPVRAAEDSEAINWGTVGKTALQVVSALLKREDELLAPERWNSRWGLGPVVFRPAQA